mmetsp:Transcript_45620/g.90438  ORF Transcript_45620/g.90438 Transcript_45620/m.90438 type:complete len:223 (+) Transcript_45620:317-985(+)
MGLAADPGAGHDQGEAGCPGLVARAGRRGRPRHPRACAARRQDHRRGRHAGQRGDEGLLEEPGGDAEGVPRRLLQFRRPRRDPRGRLCAVEGSVEGHHHLGRREHLHLGGRKPASAAPQDSGDRGRRAAGRQVGRVARGVDCREGGRRPHRGGVVRLVPGKHAALHGAADLRLRELGQGEDVDGQGPEARAPKGGERLEKGADRDYLRRRRPQVEVVDEAAE